MADVKFEIIKHLCSFSENKGYRKEINLISWKDAPAKIDIRNWKPDGTLVIGWLASQTDMLAEDWEIV